MPLQIWEVVHLLISNGVLDEGQTDLCAGTYSLTITDQANCSLIQDFNITTPDSLLVEIDSIVNESGDQSNGEIFITASGGISPYFFSWSNGSNEEDLFDLSTGNYNLTLTDANGCIFIIEGILIDNMVRLSNIKNEANWVIYPNPAKDILYLNIEFKQIPEKINTILFDEFGRQVLNQQHEVNTTDQIKVLVRNLPKGIYLLQLNIDGSSFTKRVVLF